MHKTVNIFNKLIDTPILIQSGWDKGNVVILSKHYLNNLYNIK